MSGAGWGGWRGGGDGCKTVGLGYRIFLNACVKKYDYT
jgi:hypothetical protein